MTLKDLEFLLELNGVVRNDIDYILDFGKKNGIDKEEIDDELSKLGYERLLENEGEESWDEDDDDYGYVQKFPNRHKKFSEDYD
ncbi:MAG: hypothetical protein PHO62_00475 [Sulfurimonas sp.]|uniref:hypothetical protein n=1 Tax=Sulfurimonas sp. TaxID=2022749 RepID=UPI0026095AEC|nr:hypothetical protein [Sulfurimonas sp.]MDD5371884.1 hypothetical protein [Sulfurimonas sp.]